MITIQELEAIGFKKDPEEFSPFPIGKDLNLNTPFDQPPAIALTVIRNSQEFCFIPGDGSIIFLNIESISDLVRFEEFISGVDTI